jgi:serine protease AprX
MRRVLLLLALLCAASSWPATPRAQIGGPTLSADLLTPQAPGERRRVIVQAAPTSLLSLKSTLSALISRDLGSALVMDVSAGELAQLASDPSIAHISGDVIVRGDMAMTNRITQAQDVWKGTPGLLGLGGVPGYTGDGVVVAVVDSGIAAHSALGTRVIARANFVSWEADPGTDAYGHGTHVAGAVAGSPTAASKVTPAYAGGSAPGVKLVDVRVLGSRGGGLTSDVIAGIDWTVANKDRYKIRVINLSLGHPVMEPSTTDPLCRAVARAVSAGIVVVVSAGNSGHTEDGTPIAGSVTSPGNSPFALTVGALDPQGTLDTSDDRVAEYSSRGPTKYEFVAKPEVVAPGTRLVSLEAAKSYLSTTYPQWHIAGTGKNAYMRLTGSSMSAAVVSGGVALLLDAYPNLTPLQVKLAVQLGARYVPGGGLIGGGTGSVNFAQSMKIANATTVSGTLGTVDSLLGTSSGAAYNDFGTLIDRLYDRSGLRTLGLLDLGWVFGGQLDPGVLHLLGANNPLGDSGSNHLVWGTVAGWTSSEYIAWGDAILSPSGQHLVWGTTDTTNGTHLVWGTYDHTNGSHLVWGTNDQTNGNHLVWGTSTPSDK